MNKFFNKQRIIWLGMKLEEIQLQLKLKHYKIINVLAINYLLNQLNIIKKPLKSSNFLNKTLLVI